MLSFSRPVNWYGFELDPATVVLPNGSLRLHSGKAVAHHDFQIGSRASQQREGGGKHAWPIFNLFSPQHGFSHGNGHGAALPRRNLCDGPNPLDAVGIGAIVTGEQRRGKSIVIVAAPPNMPIPLALVWR